MRPASETLDTFVARQLARLPGWTWCAYGRSGRLSARFALVSPDYRTQVGRDGETTQAAMLAAIEAALRGERS